MSAFKSLTADDVSITSVTLLGSSGSGGETIYNDGSQTLWELP